MAAGARLPGEPAHRGARRSRRGVRVLRADRGEPAFARLRDRRRRGEGRRSRPTRRRWAPRRARRAGRSRTSSRRRRRRRILRDIMVSIGRTGRATPFAVLEPVFVGGANVGMATLHNEDDVARKDVRPGDTVIVRRAGDVIPEVVGPVLAKRPPKTKPWKFPKKCPECGQPLVRVEGEANHHCVNVDCPAQRVQRLGALGGPGRARHRRPRRGARAPVRRRRAPRGRGRRVRAHASTGSYRSNASANARRSCSSTRSKARRRGRCGVCSSGSASTTSARPPRRRWRARSTTSTRSWRAGEEQLTAIDGVGPTIAQSIASWFSIDRNRRLVAAAARRGRELRGRARRTQREPIDASFAGLTFVLTGSLEHRTRDEAARRDRRARGGKVTSSVSKKTSYVVVGREPGLEAREGRGARRDDARRGRVRGAARARRSADVERPGVAAELVFCACASSAVGMVRGHHSSTAVWPPFGELLDVLARARDRRGPCRGRGRRHLVLRDRVAVDA